MKNALKTLGFLLIVAAAFLIASCGPPVEPTEDYIVTFNSDGGSSVPSKSVPNDGNSTVDKPSPDPTKTVLTDVGLYKNWPDAGYTFGGWTTAGGSDYDFSTPITNSITLKAKWTLPEGTRIDLAGNSSLTGDLVERAFQYINLDSTSISDNDKFTLYIETKYTPTTALVLKKSKANLTIIGKDNNSSEIKSPDLTSKNPTGTTTATTANVFITVGDGANPVGPQTGFTTSNPNLDTSGITLTLKSVAVVGSGVKTPNSLIRVINGATLTLDEKAYIGGHDNNGAGSYGNFGNGSAICIVNGSTLNIKQGAIVEKNKSSGTSTNTNLVGGIFVIGTVINNPAAANKKQSTVNITGGAIADNECTDGNTKDIYITECVNLNLEGNVTIGELCINADNNTSNSGDGTYGKYDYPNFVINGKVTNTINKLNLRSTNETLSTVQGAWTDKKVFSGTATYDIDKDDVAQFKLWEFTGSKSLRGTNPGDDNTKWPNWIDPEKWAITIVAKAGNTASYGKFGKVTP